ncbi:MAG: PEP-CTERM sorting domain-containing protein [Microcystaceae cyanobacterium]
MKSSLLTITTATLSLGMMGMAQAGTIVVPNSVSTPILSEMFPVTNTINQTGLSVGYTEGDDFDTYLSGNPTHTSAQGNDFRSDNVGDTTGAITFDFGIATTLESLAFWNFSFAPSLGNAVTSFSLEASLTSDFSSSTNLGTFSPTVPSTNPTTAQVFPFAPTNAQFIRLNILANNSGNRIGIGEVLFEESQDIPPTPEPSSVLGLLLIGGVGLFAKKRLK